MKHAAAAKKIESLCEELGFHVASHHAQTGTVYLTIDTSREHKLGRELKIRFSDHADAYGSSDYTADGCEGTLSGAETFLLGAAGLTKKTVARLRRYRRSLRVIRAREAAKEMLSREAAAKLVDWIDFRISIAKKGQAAELLAMKEIFVSAR